MSESTYLGRNISIAYRLSNRFYDRVLSPYQIGCGQQFFLLRIYENQGISMYDLARMGRFDKGTVTRAVQKLEEQGYVRCVPDERDKRVRRLYTTDLFLKLPPTFPLPDIRCRQMSSNVISNAVYQSVITV